MNEQIKIDETYTYVYDNGAVSMLRHGEPWLGAGTYAPMQAPKAWIAAANEIEELRVELRASQSDLEVTLDDLNEALREIEQLKRVNAHLESRTIQEPTLW